MMPVVYHPAALDELAEADRYYESRQTGLGERFQKLVQTIESEISENPETGFIHDHGTRFVCFASFRTG